MIGLKAIAAHNGWTISFVGITIVFSALTVLSIIISQLHKILSFWEDRKTFFKKVENNKNNQKILDKADFPNETVCLKQFKLLINKIGDPFSLPELIKTAEMSGLSKAGAKVSELIRLKKIIPNSKGYYKWDDST